MGFDAEDLALLNDWQHGFPLQPRPYQALGARLLEEAATAPDYKLYALDTTPPVRAPISRQMLFCSCFSKVLLPFLLRCAPRP